jgi:hypothetical protein
MRGSIVDYIRRRCGCKHSFPIEVGKAWMLWGMRCPDCGFYPWNIPEEGKDES